MLDLEHNRIDALPEYALHHLPKLTYFDLSFSPLTVVSRDVFLIWPGIRSQKPGAETILHLILWSSLKYAYVWFIEWTYEQKTCVRISFRCEIYESQIILNSHAIEWFHLSACKRLLINVNNI